MKKYIVAFILTAGPLVFAGEACFNVDFKFNSHADLACPQVNSLCVTDYHHDAGSGDLILKNSAGSSSYRALGRFVQDQSDVGQDIGLAFSSDDLYISLHYPTNGMYPAGVTGPLERMMISTGKTSPHGGVYSSQVCLYELR